MCRTPQDSAFSVRYSSQYLCNCAYTLQMLLKALYGIRKIHNLWFLQKDHLHCLKQDIDFQGCCSCWHDRPYQDESHQQDRHIASAGMTSCTRTLQLGKTSNGLFVIDTPSFRSSEEVDSCFCRSCLTSTSIELIVSQNMQRLSDTVTQDKATNVQRTLGGCTSELNTYCHETTSWDAMFTSNNWTI